MHTLKYNIMTEYISKPSYQRSFKHFFNQLKDESIDDLLELGKIIQVKPDTTIITQGDNTTDVYFLIFGRIQVLVQNDYGEEIILNEISQGEFFGEMSLLTGERRAATLITTKESTLLKVKKRDFEKLLDIHPSILKYINTILVNRLRMANLSKNSTSFQNVCFLQLESKSKDNDFLKLLQKKLSQKSSVFIITKEKAYEAGIFNDSDNEKEKKYKFTNWIHNLRSRYNNIVFVCNANNPLWSEFCLGEADRIMLVGSKNLSPNLTRLEEDIFLRKNIASKIEKNLIINWAENEKIIDTARILQHRQVKNIFHVTPVKGIGRVIRYIIGKSVKLVLGGGGAKGFAHLGVYKAMCDLGIPVDFVGETSVESIVGAGIASGWDYDKLQTAIYDTLVARNPLNDYQLPLVSLLKGEKLNDLLHEYFGNNQIEDLVHPFYAVASNFSKSKIEILNKGAISFAVRASISLPAVLPPVVKDNSLLVDGGLMDNLPFDSMDSLAQGPTIGVDLSMSKKRSLSYDKIPSNGTLLKQKFFGKRKHKVPGLSQIIMGTMTLASEDKRRKNEEKFNVYIKPDVSKYGFLKWKNFDNILKCGYDASYPILKKWKETATHQFVS